MAVIFVTVPAYLHAIGADKYGVLSLVWIVFGYFGVLDFGIGRAATAAISRASDRRDAVHIIWSAVILNAVLGALVAALGGAAFLAFARYSPGEMVDSVMLALPAMMFGIPVLMITATLNGALDAQERFKLSNGLQLAGTILYQVAPLLAAYWISTDVAVLIITVILARTVLLALYAIAVTRVFGLFASPSASIARMKALLVFGRTIAGVSILDPIFSRIDQIFIARFAGTEGVAAYSIAINSIGRISIFPFAMSRSIFPKLSTGKMEDHTGTLFNAMSRIIWIWFALCALAIVASDIAFELWLLRDPIAPTVASISKMFVVGLWANCLGALPYTALQAGGRSGSILKAHMAELPIYVVAMVVLTYSYGAYGAAIAYTLRSFADTLILWWITGFRLRQQSKYIGLFFALTAISILSENFRIELGLFFPN